MDMPWINLYHLQGTYIPRLWFFIFKIGELVPVMENT